AFALPATDGRVYTLDDVRGPKGLLVVFMCNHCPYVLAALPNIVRDARELAALGIGIVVINSNDAVAYPEDSFERMVA
ncbi:redoxin family protein, partial [Klebsiella quasipneumoniae]|uniref:redoxin family protein n=1 Tax=Klebsiella quasipneumoniae TaxID=1463165 RepID=UPI00214F4A8A